MSEKMPSPEEMSKIQKSRILSDAELVKGGADVSPEGKISATDNQIKDARIEMNEDLAGRYVSAKKEKGKSDTEMDVLRKLISDRKRIV